MSKEAMTLALEALHGFIPYLPLKDETQCEKYDSAIKALEEALAKQKQGEPVLLIQSHRDGFWCADLTCKKCYSADFRFKHKNSVDKESLTTQQKQGEPVAKNENGSITWLIDDWPQNCLLYTHPPKSFTYEQVKAHIRAASMSANDIVVGSDVTNDGVSVVIRRRDEVLYAEFFATPQPAHKPLTDEFGILEMTDIGKNSVQLIFKSRKYADEFKAAHSIKE